jgi:hypothetical protein
MDKAKINSQVKDKSVIKDVLSGSREFVTTSAEQARQYLASSENRKTLIKAIAGAGLFVFASRKRGLGLVKIGAQFASTLLLKSLEKPQEKSKTSSKI